MLRFVGSLILILALGLILALAPLAITGGAYANGGDEAEVELEAEVLPPLPPGGGGGDAPLPPRLTLEVDMWGKVAAGGRTTFGTLVEPIEAVSDGGVVTLLIRNGTEVVDPEGGAIDRITVEPVEPPPLAPGNYAIDAYDFTPTCTFDPAVELKILYDEQALPEGFDETYLVIEYYREDEGWRELPTVVDTFANSVSALIGHLTVFAIVAQPPQLTITSLLVSPIEVDPEESVTITVEVANTSTALGSRTIELWIEGQLEDSRKISLDPGAVESLTFTVSREEPGVYRLAVDGMAGDFTVSEEEESAWWPLAIALGLLVAAGAAAVAGVYSLRRRSATKTELKK